MVMKWTKRLDKMHLEGEGGRTMCGKPMLGTNYARMYPDRKMCEKCKKRYALLSMGMKWHNEKVKKVM